MTDRLDLRTDSPEALAWQAARDAEATAVLAALPEVERARDVLARFAVRDVEQAPRHCGGRWFRREVVRGSHDPVVGWSLEPTGRMKVLADPAARTEQAGRPVAVDLFEPSPDGRLVLLGTSEAGSERTRLQIVEVATGAELEELEGDALPLATWLPDSSGVFYVTRDGASTPLRLHAVGKGSAEEPLPKRLLFPNVRVSPTSSWAVVLEGNGEIRTPYARTPAGEWFPLLSQVDGGHWGVPHGDAYIAVLDGDAPRGRLMRIPFASVGDPSSWTELLPESADVLRTVTVVGDRIVVSALRRCAVVLLVLEADGRLVGEVPLPEPGVVLALAAPASHPLAPAVMPGGGSAITFLFSTMRSSWAVFRYDLVSGELEELQSPAHRLEAEVVLCEAMSADGTAVPYELLVAGNGPRATLLHGYGGFGVALLPGWDPLLSAWVELGGTVALMHPRGGGELGREWWEQGRLERKANGWDDAVAVAEAVRRDGVASRLAVQGASNGGLLAGALLARRPDLWDVVVSEVPILDLLGYGDEPITLAIAAREYGDPRRTADRAWLQRLSPLHAIANRPAYPPLLLLAGANDPRCPAWHARTFAARITEASPDSTVLLRIMADVGHGAAQHAAKVATASEWMGFAAHHTGLTSCDGSRFSNHDRVPV